MNCEDCAHEKVCEGYSNCEEAGLCEPKRPHGEWIRIDKWVDAIYVGGFIHKDCPMIKVSDDCFYAPLRYNFCPNCGADMRGDDET